MASWRRCWTPAGQPRRWALAKAETLATPGSAGLWELRARAEAALGKRLAQHRSLAEVYAIQGNYAESANQACAGAGRRGWGFLRAVGGGFPACGRCACCWRSSCASRASS